MAQINFFFANPKHKNTTFVNIVQNFQLYTSKTLLKTNPNPLTPYLKSLSFFKTQKTKLNTNPSLLLRLKVATETQIFLQPQSSNKRQREPSSSMVKVNRVATPTNKNKKKPTNKRKTTTNKQTNPLSSLFEIKTHHTHLYRESLPLQSPPTATTTIIRTYNPAPPRPQLHNKYRKPQPITPP